MSQSNDQFVDVYRSALKSGLGMMNICLGSIERLRDYQADAVEKIRAGHDAAAKGIDSLRSIEDLQKAHVEMARGQMERLASYWGGFYGLCSQYQTEVFSEAQAKAHAVGEEIGHTLETTSPAVAPMLSAIKLALGTAESTYAATARVTDDMAHFGAAQISHAARHGNGKVRRASAV